ncbi:MAG: hypothetical protein M3Z23_11475 [Acidobacteriota bacterium]|nr:hypothetical protein [Acidobacteriota bacterium]
MASVNRLVIIHGIVFFAWLGLFFVQTTLVATARTALHRRLGIVSIPLGLIMVPLGYTAAIEMTRRGFDLSGDLHIQADPLMQLIFPLGDLVTFVVFISAALFSRRRPDFHKRLMLLGTLGSMMPAAVAHFLGHNLQSIPALIVPILAVLFLSPAIYDRVRFGRFHRVSLSGGLILFLWANLRATVIGPSVPWHTFAKWLVS